MSTTTPAPPSANTPGSPRLFTFKSGGWVLVLTAVLSVVIVVMTVGPVVGRMRNRPPGDGRDPASYGFDLTTCLVPRESLVAGQLHRDLIAPLVDPAVMPAGSVEAFNAEQRGKFMVPSDRVIGVEIAGEARAYPLVTLKLHEVVNDTLGGLPIVVTYNPLCDSAMVFERTGPDGNPREFGVSGLLYNSNLLMYDRVPGGGESLWSQLQARAVTGPAAAEGAVLTAVTSVVVHWEDWMAMHANTTVASPIEDLLKRYQETTYAPYFRSDELLFPVEVAVPAAGPGPKAPCVVLTAGSRPRAYPLSLIAARADASGRWTDDVDGVTYTFHHRHDPSVAWITRRDGERDVPVPTFSALWFAVYAMDPGIELIDA